jgi:hypothetical protein
MLRRTTLAHLAPAAAVFGVLLVGCTQRPAARPILLETPTPLVADATLVSPIDRAGAVWTRDATSHSPPILLSDGQRVPASVAALHRRLPASAASSWLPDAGPWQRTTTFDERTTTMLVAELPPSAMGQSVWMDGRPLPAFWLLPELHVGPRPAPTQRLSASADQVVRLLEPELSDPAIRWRAELALERLGIPPPEPAWTDPILRAWHEQSKARWAAAQRRLRAADPLVAERLFETLTRWLVTPDATLPAWPTRTDEINDLVLAILRPGASDQGATRTALAFLERQPQWLAWVVDDAGGVVGGSIAVANFSPVPALLSVRAPTGAWQAHGMVEPDALALVPVPTSPAAASPAMWEVRLGGRTRALPITTEAIGLEPPGLTIGPFWHDWTLEGLFTGTAQSPAPGQAAWIGGLIQMDPRLDAASSGWVLYVEVRRPPCDLPGPGQLAASTDAVRLSFGPTNSPRAVVTVRCTGLTTFDTGAPGEVATLDTSGDRWAFTLPIDSAWFEPDGTILLGAQSLPGAGARATWPRPLLPGQHTPGRVRVDPAAWSLQAAVDRHSGIVTSR